MNRSKIADLCLLLVAMMWGSTFEIVQHVRRMLPPMAFNSVRFLEVCATEGTIEIET
ncbi:hypothetical protein JCM10914A_08630 [Paenibacillus sp. JCM 10914]|uniref:hypothetical protein n=1 Tax=Paenibacillus sp. JCM 10914 TaxID=1236974 RepID=UPI0003CC9590|nr:cell division protein FtsI [Paenibacillus sp. JCM 10914]